MKRLSPTKLGTFLQCPARFKYKYVDFLPEPGGPAADRGNLVHDALELLFDAPPEKRTLAHGLQCVDMVSAGYPNVSVDEAGRLVHNLYALEDPTTINAVATETELAHTFEGERECKGFYDRLDAEGEELILVDYKTGKAPSAKDQDEKALGIKYYGMISEALGKPPARLVLLYLGTPAKVTIEFTPLMARSVHNKTMAAWDAIEINEQSGTWKAKPSFSCKFCAYMDLCPEGKKSVDRGKTPG